MEQPKVHYPAVLVAAVIQFVVGWLWYGVMFQQLWINATGVTIWRWLRTCRVDRLP